MFNKSFKVRTIWVVIAAILVVVLFSTFYTGDCARHDCTGEDCPVCEALLQCARNLSTVGAAVFVMVSVAVVKAALEPVFTVVWTVSCNSLLSQKVRWNN